MAKENASYRVLQALRFRSETLDPDGLDGFIDLTGPLADRDACLKWCRTHKVDTGRFQIAKFVGDRFSVAVETVEKRSIVPAAADADPTDKMV